MLIAKFSNWHLCTTAYTGCRPTIRTEFTNTFEYDTTVTATLYMVTFTRKSVLTSITYIDLALITFILIVTYLTSEHRAIRAESSSTPEYSITVITMLHALTFTRKFSFTLKTYLDLTILIAFILIVTYLTSRH